MIIPKGSVCDIQHRRSEGQKRRSDRHTVEHGSLKLELSYSNPSVPSVLKLRIVTKP